MIRIATVFGEKQKPGFEACAMDKIRWIKVSEALARLGYQVDMIINNGHSIIQRDKNLRYMSFDHAHWKDYDVIKTFFHKGFRFLLDSRVNGHPFLISKLGSVVGKTDDVKGVYFFNSQREELYQIQRLIAHRCKYITVLTEQSKNLWKKEFGQVDKTLLVPTGVDKDVPPPGTNPYKKFNEKIAVYIGNIYSQFSQKEMNSIWQERLNVLGRLLKKKGIRLCLIGLGDTHELDHDAVTYLGNIEHHKIWDYQYYAHAGIVLAQGEIQHNESSKIYYYLRTGLPVVCEEPVPNNSIIHDAHLGFVVKYNDNNVMADKIEEAVYTKWDTQRAIDYILKHHTWDRRVTIYDQLIKKEFSWKL